MSCKVKIDDKSGLESEIVWWKEYMRGMKEEPINLAFDRPLRKSPHYVATNVTISVPDKLTSQLITLEARYGVSLYSIFLATFSLLLSKLCGERELVIGTDVRCNTLAIAGLSNFDPSCAVPIIIALSGKRSLIQTVQEVNLGIEAVKNNSATAFKDLRKGVFDRTGCTIYIPNVLFTATCCGPSNDQETISLKRQKILAMTKTNVEAKLHVNLERVGITGVLTLPCAAFDSSTPSRLRSYFFKILSELANEPEQNVEDLQITSSVEREKVLKHFNSTEKEYEGPELIHQLFEEQVTRTPEAVAVIFENISLSYLELNERANRLAHYLRRLGAVPESLIAIFMNRSIDLVVSLLAILKAGAAYVPLDPGLPKIRIAQMLKDCRASVLITTAELRGQLPEFSGAVVPVDDEQEKIDAKSSTNLVPGEIGLSPRNLAYVTFYIWINRSPKRRNE